MALVKVTLHQIGEGEGGEDYYSCHRYRRERGCYDSSDDEVGCRALPCCWQLRGCICFAHALHMTNTTTAKAVLCPEVKPYPVSCAPRFGLHLLLPACTLTWYLCTLIAYQGICFVKQDGEGYCWEDEDITAGWTWSGEVHDQNMVASHWTSLEGKALGLGEVMIEEEDIMQVGSCVVLLGPCEHLLVCVVGVI